MGEWIADAEGDIMAGGGGMAWEYVLTHLPWARHGRLWDDVGKGLDETYRKGSVDALRACMEYLEIRYQFFHHLEQNGRNLRHVNTYEMQIAEGWHRKIKDKLEATKRGRVTRERGWLKDKVPKKVHHGWLH